MDAGLILAACRTAQLGFILAALYLWGLLTYQLRAEWSLNPQYSYGWAVPFLTAYLLWEQWMVRPAPAVISDGMRRGVLLLAVGILALILPVRLVIEANADWRLASWVLALAAVSLTLLWFVRHGGKPWARHFAFPLLFFLVSVPWPTWLEHRWIQGLTRANAALTIEGLVWSGIPALQRGNLIEIATGVVGINEACSGIRSFQGTLMIALFMGAFYQLNPKRRVALVLGGAAVAFGCNVVRTFLLVRVAARDGTGAIATWHDPAGMLILAVCLLVLWGLAVMLAGKPAAVVRPAGVNPLLCAQSGAAWGWGACVWLAGCEVATQAWFAMHERRLPVAQEWSVAWPQTREGFRFLPVTDEVRQILHYDEGMRASWREPDGTRWQAFYFRWNPGRTASTLARNHTPEICLPAAGRTITSMGEPWVAAGTVVPIKFRSFAFQIENRPVFVFYALWEDREADQDVASATLTRRRRLDAVREGRRNRGQRVLQIAIVGCSDLASAEERLRRQLPSLISGESSRSSGDPGRAGESGRSRVDG